MSPYLLLIVFVENCRIFQNNHTYPYVGNEATYIFFTHKKIKENTEKGITRHGENSSFGCILIVQNFYVLVAKLFSRHNGKEKT